MSDQNPKKLGRAFTAAVGADWMITEDGLRTLLAIAGRIKSEKAVEAQDSEPLEYTRTCDIRDGVAIIPVDGPIFRYANLFTYFSGGTSVDVLAKDFNAALRNDKVHAIMFEVNSPGGEVTGINEFCEMIYNARSTKPVTARVGGSGCSAAYWISSACGDVVIDETAMLGSIGVMAVYLDDRKALEMEGFEEIEFISSQSPYKNSPPWTDEGKKRIQTRIDALAQVFVAKVARNRDVSVDTVLKQFGQGDVFVGEAAIEAGLADRLGSFEETIHQLAKTHNPYFTDTSAQDPAQKTINDFNAVNSQPVIEQVLNGAEETAFEGETMKEEKTDEQTTADQPNAAQPAPAAAAAAPAPAKTDASAESVESLQKQLADSKAESKTLNERIATLEEEATNKWIADQVKTMGGEAESNTSVLTALVKAYGRDAEAVTTFVKSGQAQKAQEESSDLFNEIGKTGSGNDTDSSAEAKLDKLAKEKAAADKITFEKAYIKVLDENPDLARAIV